MQSNRSYDHHHRRSISNGSVMFSPRTPRDREGLMRAFDAENQQYRLSDLGEDAEGEAEGRPNGNTHSMNGNHVAKPT
jgi:hypothetical protein